MCQRDFFVYHITGSTRSGFFFLSLFQGHIQYFERAWKKSIYIKGKFAKSVHF